MYAIGTSLFLIMLIFTLSTSLINPTYGMSEGAVMEIEIQSSGSGTDKCCEHKNRNIICKRVSIPGEGTWTFYGPERSEEHTSELQSRGHLVCRLLLEKTK